MFYTFLFLSTIALLIYLYGIDLKSRYFAWLMDRFTKELDPKYTNLKKDFFEPLNSQKSHIPELRNENAIKILEVGVGTELHVSASPVLYRRSCYTVYIQNVNMGINICSSYRVNFEFYPENTRLVVVDPNPHFKSYYDSNRSKFSNIHSEEIILSTGEEMDFIESGSVDAVVMTLVMCSVQDVRKVVQQAHRVLAPGGKLFFFEHVREWDGKEHPWRQGLHDFFSFTRIWPFLFDGCYLNRDPISAIKEVGFSDINKKYTYAPIDHFFLQIIKPHLIGNATKGSEKSKGR